MRFSTRAFLSSFVPFAALLLASFWLIRNSVLSTVREGIRASLRDTHASVVRSQTKSETHNRRLLRVLGENATIKAGLRLFTTEPDSQEARFTLIDQLGELAQNHGFDLLAIADPDGKPIGGVMRSGEEWVTLNKDDSVVSPKDSRWAGRNGIYPVGKQTFQLSSVPVNLGDEQVGILTVGEGFDFGDFTAPTVLSRNGAVIQSGLTGVQPSEVEAALDACRPGAECELHLQGRLYLSLPVESLPLGEGFTLRSFQDVDAANRPVQHLLTQVFLVSGIGALLAALVLSTLSSRAVVQPIASVVRQLRQSEQTLDLPDFREHPSSIPEIRELASAFQRAATAVREGREGLRHAYIGFIGSLASALDARDRYTAGHSDRVSQMATITARRMNLAEDQVEIIRIGALLHDIGKIGVPDQVLQKPGALTPEEFDLIKLHPTIGRRILEPVGGFEDYLPIVELHHENWDGSGYPHGLAGEAVPIGARIVHVVDAYDAMTTDRPYRLGMSHIQAVGLLRKLSGTVYDPIAVEVFLDWRTDDDLPVDTTTSIHRLATALAPAPATREVSMDQPV